MKQDRGCVVGLDKSKKYTEKCFHILQTEQFTKLRHEPTKSIENKIQQELRKFRTRLTIQKYGKFYPTDSNPGRFYVTAKLHKLPTNGTIECSFSNYRSNKRYTSQKTVSRIRVRISSAIKMDETPLLFYKVVSTKLAAYIYILLLQ